MIWAQYDIGTGLICGTNSNQVSDDALAAIGRAQVQVANEVDGLAYRIDLSQIPPVAIPSGD
jgi:hypothetical protein